MRKIEASEAKAQLPQLLGDVERAETFTATRNGRPIARIVPEVDKRQEGVDLAIERIRALQRRTGKITTAEILSARDEGRKY